MACAQVPVICVPANTHTIYNSESPLALSMGGLQRRYFSKSLRMKLRANPVRQLSFLDFRCTKVPVICVPANTHTIYNSESPLTLSMGGLQRPYYSKSLRMKSWENLVRRLSFLDFRCNSSMSSGNNGSTNEGFRERDGDYINSTVFQAVEVKSGSEGFLIKMSDGRFVRCVHNSPHSGYLLEYATQPAIVLKMEDGSNLLLPIIILELPCTMLMEAVSNAQVVRPTIYHVLKELVETMGLKVKLVRVTKRVDEVYFAELYLSKQDGEEIHEVCLDMKPSDAINIAVQCQAPIQVNRLLAYGDGVRVVNDPKRSPSQTQSSTTFVLDRPQSESCIEAEEFSLVKSMIIAAVEERYKDAARLRDQLKEFRSQAGGKQH